MNESGKKAPEAACEIICSNHAILEPVVVEDIQKEEVVIVQSQKVEINSAASKTSSSSLSSKPKPQGKGKRKMIWKRHAGVETELPKEKKQTTLDCL